MSPNQSKTWKTLLQIDNQNKSDSDNQNKSDTDNQNQSDTDPNQQISMLEEQSDSFSQSNASQPDYNHNENNVSDTRRTRSGQIYACYSQAELEKSPLFLHPSLATLTLNSYDVCTTKDTAGESETSQPFDTSGISHNKPASGCLPDTQTSGSEIQLQNQLSNEV